MLCWQFSTKLSRVDAVSFICDTNVPRLAPGLEPAERESCRTATAGLAEYVRSSKMHSSHQVDHDSRRPPVARPASLPLLALHYTFSLVWSTELNFIGTFSHRPQKGASSRVVVTFPRLLVRINLGTPYVGHKLRNWKPHALLMREEGACTVTSRPCLLPAASIRYLLLMCWEEIYKSTPLTPPTV